MIFDFGGLRVRSTFDLHGLTRVLEDPTDERPADIDISLSTAPPPRGRPVYVYRGRYQLAVEACGDDWLIRHGDNLGVTIAKSGRVLDCHCPDPARLPLLTEILTRRVLPRISGLHGRLPMHGATLGDGHGATMLLGSSGAGKSTMTAALARYLGWGIFSDDMSIVSDEGRHMVFPTTLGVSVWRQSQLALGLPPEECRPLQNYEGKAWYSPAPAVAPPPQPLEAVILLSFDLNGGEIDCRRLAGPDALVKVSSQLVAFNPRDNRAIAALFERATRLIATIPIYALSYPRDYEALPAVVDTIRRLRTGAPSEPA
ncbi:MAG: hypothetical protein ABI818_11810 [Acidobacteriota bacterium]